jgi:hypothetical protein
MPEFQSNQAIPSEGKAKISGIRILEVFSRIFQNLTIISNPNLQISMGKSGAQYALKNFDGAKAADRFLQYFAI